MNRILAVPNWTIFAPELVDSAAKIVGDKCFVHFAKGDIDHRRTVTGFSGSQEDVFEAMILLADQFFPLIDLRQEKGVHPASGALDVAPFVLLEGEESALIEQCREFAREFGNRYSVPVLLYEKAAFPGQETALPVLRGQTKKPVPAPFVDFPAHPQWGQVITGVRDFLVAANLNLSSISLADGRKIAAEIRRLREEGDVRFAGVRALAFWLESRGLLQLSFNFTRPDQTCFDEVFDYVDSLFFGSEKVQIEETELIGVIRDVDLARSTRLKINPDQIVKSAKL